MSKDLCNPYRPETQAGPTELKEHRTNGRGAIRKEPNSNAMRTYGWRNIRRPACLYRRCCCNGWRRTERLPQPEKMENASLLMGAVVFSLCLTSRRLEQSPHFLGGAVLCSLFSFSVLMTPWQQLQQTLKHHGFQSYQQYLESDHWRDLRRRKGVKDCCVCVTGKPLVVHHMNYRDLLDVGLDDLIGMCQKCHDDFHLGCRYMKVSYIDAGPPVIRHIVSLFRSMPKYAKMVSKRARKKAVMDSKPVPTVSAACFWLVGFRDGQKFDITNTPMPKKVVKQFLNHSAKYFKSLGTRIELERRDSANQPF